MTDEFQPSGKEKFSSAHSRDLAINEVMVSALIHSHHSQASQKSGSSYDLDDESRDKGLCPIPECGRVFKDLKAHMFTHQNERPEKCPIATCESTSRDL